MAMPTLAWESALASPIMGLRDLAILSCAARALYPPATAAIRRRPFTERLPAHAQYLVEEFAGPNDLWTLLLWSASAATPKLRSCTLYRQLPWWRTGCWLPIDTPDCHGPSLWTPHTVPQWRRRDWTPPSWWARSGRPDGVGLLPQEHTDFVHQLLRIRRNVALHWTEIARVRRRSEEAIRDAL